MPAAMPTPFDPSLPLTNLGTTDLVNQISALDLASRLAAHGRVRGYATVPPNDHESQGVFFFGNAPPYNAFFGTQTAYEALQKPLTAPAGTSGLEQLFSPTMHPAWSSCLENSTFYISSSSSATSHFTVFNFCLTAGSFVFDANVDSKFLSEYVRLNSDGYPSYASEIFTTDKQPSGTSPWYSILYNFSKARYDLIISKPSDGFYSPDAFGWSIIEPFFAQGPCPQIAPAMAAALSVHNTTSGLWDPLMASMAGGATTVVTVQGGSQNNCLLGDNTGPASINFLTLVPNSKWRATSPR